jgi:hypothetical protein
MGSDFFFLKLTLPTPDVRDILPTFDETQFLSVQKSVAGFDDEMGSFVTRFDNRDPHNNVTIRSYELVPWYVQLYLHSIRFHFSSDGVDGYSLRPLDAVYVNRKEIETDLSQWIVTQWARDCEYDKGHSVIPLPPSYSMTSSRSLGNLLYIRLTPAINRVTPAVVEFIAQLAPNTSMLWTASYDLALLSFYEYPPDAHRGFDVGSAAVSFRFHGKKRDSFPERDYITRSVSGLEWPKCILYSLHGKGDNRWMECVEKASDGHALHTEMVRVMLPTPDFSMPYNVIVFSCTILGIFFGQILNSLLVRLSPLKEGKDIPSTRLLSVFIAYLFGKIFRKKEEDGERKQKEKSE